MLGYKSVDTPTDSTVTLGIKDDSVRNPELLHFHALEHVECM